ncbi:MAG: hypothetical protein WCS69_16355 [Ignavibacteriaceae bacterium]
MLYDKPTVGTSQYGEYYLYTVRNGDGATEYSFFADPTVHEKLKDLKKGAKAIVTKIAEQKGSKLVVRYEVETEGAKSSPQPSPIIPQTSDGFYEQMLQSCKDAMKIQAELGGMMDAKSLAVTLFIARSRISANGCGG